MTEHEIKRFESEVKIVDAEKGIVEHFFSVFGNTDLVGDIVHDGSFTKTLSERGNKVRVLDMHNSDSIMRVVGKPINIQEVGRDELPDYILAKYPDATGGVKATTQLLMDTPEGKGAFIRLKEGAVDEWSFGFDVIKKDYSQDEDGNSIRHIREVRLWEYGPVIWGANPATATVGVKSDQSDKDDKRNVFYNEEEKRALTLSEVAFERAFKGQFAEGFYGLMDLLAEAVFTTLGDERLELSAREKMLLQAVDDFHGLSAQFITTLFASIPQPEGDTGELKLSETEIVVEPTQDDSPDPVEEPISDDDDDASVDTEKLLALIEIEQTKNLIFETGA